MGHMMNSVILGAIFVALVRAARPGPAVAAMAGVVYGLVVYALMFWVVLRHVPTLWAPDGVQSFLSSNPELSWVVGHLVFGMVLGGLVAYGPVAAGYGRRRAARGRRLSAARDSEEARRGPVPGLRTTRRAHGTGASTQAIGRERSVPPRRRADRAARRGARRA